MSAYCASAFARSRGQCPPKSIRRMSTLLRHHNITADRDREVRLRGRTSRWRRGTVRCALRPTIPRLAPPRARWARPRARGARSVTPHRGGGRPRRCRSTRDCRRPRRPRAGEVDLTGLPLALNEVEHGRGLLTEHARHLAGCRAIAKLLYRVGIRDSLSTLR